MKKTPILLILSALFLFTCKEKNTELTYGNPTYFTFSGEIGTNDNSTFLSYDNNLLICGTTGGKLSLIKINKSGNQIWRNDFNTDSLSSTPSLVEAKNNNLFLCAGTYRNWSNSRSDILLIKANELGDTIWTKTFGGTNDEFTASIIETSDGNILLTGEVVGIGLSADIYLTKVNDKGEPIWTKTFASPEHEHPFSLIETANGEFLVTGIKSESNMPHLSSTGLYLLKVDLDGNKLWDKTIGSEMWKWGYSSIELPNGDLITCGQYPMVSTLLPSTEFSQVLVVKTDKLGNIIWEKEYGNKNLMDKGTSIKRNADGSFSITGSSYVTNTKQDDIILLKIDQYGNELWFKKFGSSATDWGANLVIDSNNDNIITGEYSGHIFMARIDQNGNYK